MVYARGVLKYMMMLVVYKQDYFDNVWIDRAVLCYCAIHDYLGIDASSKTDKEISVYNNMNNNIGLSFAKLSKSIVEPVYSMTLAKPHV